MDKLKLAALGERLKTGGERLKSGSAQISRTISYKMKEILQGPTQESKMVDEATSDHLEEPNWGLNLRICGLLNGDELSGPEFVRAIKKKIASSNTMSQILSLDLLEICAMNCDKVFSAIASEKLLEDMVRMIHNPQTHHSVRHKATQLIRAWGESDDLGYLPVFRQTYTSLKAREVTSSIQHDMTSEQLYSLLEPDADQEPLPLPDEYPNTNVNLLHLDDQNPSNHGLPLSVEDKKEHLVVTRNCIELLSSILNSESQQKPVKDDLTLGILEKCKQSKPVIQQIVETAGDDEGILFEAFNLHEDLQNILSKYEDTEASVLPERGTSDTSHRSCGPSVQFTSEKLETQKNPSYDPSVQLTTEKLETEKSPFIGDSSGVGSVSKIVDGAMASRE